MRNRNSLSTRLRNINITLFLILTLIIVIAMFFILQNITNKVSKDYAKFYADNVVGTLDTYLKGELALIAKAGKSNAIIDWFEDENNQVKKQAAYDEMKGILEVSSSNNLYAGISKTLHEYDIEKTYSVEDVEPLFVLSTDIPKDDWYFECVNSNKEYLLNVDIDKAFNRKLVWLNYKVQRNGITYGAICAGLGFSEIVEELFAEYESEEVRSLIIDEHGVIQMDSTLIGDKDFLFTLDDEKHLTDEFSNVVFLEAVQEYTKEIDGYYNEDSPTTVLELEGEKYQYVTIAPIDASTWAVITFYSSSALFGIGNLLPMVVVMLISCILFIIVTNRSIVTFFIKPFKKLMVSINAVNLNLNEPVYGTDRKDEIGALAITVQNMKDNLIDALGKVHYDSLTGIYNRRYLDEHLTQVLKTLSEYKGHISILMLDIDYFKKYNDTYGHNAGDDCLKKIATIITECVSKEGDFVARYGGEEFIVILSETSQSDGCIVAENIIQSIRIAELPHKSSEISEYISVSIGVSSSVVEHTIDAQEYIKQADEALYLSKQTGRNKYSIYIKEK